MCMTGMAALTPVYLRFGRRPKRLSSLTIHNIAFQGQFSADIFQELALPWNGLAYGLDRVLRPSRLPQGRHARGRCHHHRQPLLCREILTPEFASGWKACWPRARMRCPASSTASNTEVWNPATDPMIAAQYDAARLEARRANRKPVLDRFKLDAPKARSFASSAA